VIHVLHVEVFLLESYISFGSWCLIKPNLIFVDIMPQPQLRSKLLRGELRTSPLVLAQVLVLSLRRTADSSKLMAPIGNIQIKLVSTDSLHKAGQ